MDLRVGRSFHGRITGRRRDVVTCPSKLGKRHCMHMGKVGSIFLGAVLTVLGCFIMIRPRFYSRLYSYYFDFTGYGVFYGISLILLGIVFIRTGIKQSKRAKEKFVICPRCMTSFCERDIQGTTCPKCSGTVEDLSGFYDRHPECRVK